MDVAQVPSAGLGTVGARRHVLPGPRCRRPSSGRELLFDLPELHYPDRLNCARGAARPATGRRRPAVPARRRRRRGPTASCARSADRVAARAGRRPRPGARQPGAAARAERARGWWPAGSACSRPAASRWPRCRCCAAASCAAIAELARPALALCDAPASPTTCAAGLPGLRSCYAGDAEPDRARRRRRTAVRRRSTPPPTTSRCSPSPPAPPAGPKATMHFHRDVLAIADTFSRHVLRPTADDVFTGTPAARVHLRARRRWWSSRCGPARRRCCSSGRPRTQLADAVAEHGVTVLFTAPTAYRAMLAAGRADRLAGAAPRVSAGEALPGAGLARVPRRDRPADHRRDRLDRDAARLHLAPPTTTSGPAATGRPVPGYRAAVLDDDGRPGARRHAGPARRAAARPAAATSPTTGRQTTCGTAGTSPATPTSATPTATSATWPAATT